VVEQELLNSSVPGYRLVSSYCRRKYLKGGVCIFIKEDILYEAIHLRKICRERNL
jgi:hypothetical protein